MQTIGERLEEARKKKGISIREAAEATKIRGDYLQRFESNHFDIGLTEIYTRGFLRTYSNFLKLQADRILNDYAALGRGDVRPRQPNREVYGRMDISVGTAEGGERAANAPEETVAAPEPSHANRGPQRSRAATSLPTGPDPAKVFKIVKWVGLGVIGILAILLVKALFTGDRPAPPVGSSSASVPATKGSAITLHAIRPVRVTVSKKMGPDDVVGELVFSGTLSPNDPPKVVPRTGIMFVEGDPRDALELEINGVRYNLGQKLAPHTHLNRGEIQAP